MPTIEEQGGWPGIIVSAVQNHYANKSAKKQALSEEERQSKAQLYASNLTNLQQKISSLPKGSQEYNDAFNEIQNNLHGVRELYDPDRHPGLIASHGHLITDALGITNPATNPGIKKEAARRAAGVEGDERAAQGIAAAAPLSPEQQAQAGIAKTNAENDASIAWLRKNNAPQEVVDSAIAHIAGAPPSKGTKAVGQPYQDANDKKWYQRYLNNDGTDFRVEVANFTPKPVVKKGLKYEPQTGEVVDQDTQKRYSIADVGKQGTPQEVVQMFQDSKTAMDEKQRKALELANQRGISLGANRYTGFVDPNNPTQVIPATWGDAAKRGLRLATGAQYQTMEGMLKSSTSGPIAEQMVAFSTAFQHADLLENAAKALNNGDTRLMNQVTNDLATQFGDEAPTNFTTIATAYTREVNKALSSGHVTDAELTTVGATIPLNASPAQILGAIQAYRKLMQSKINIRMQQIQAGMQGTPFTGVGGGTPPNVPKGATHKVEYPKGSKNWFYADKDGNNLGEVKK